MFLYFTAFLAFSSPVVTAVILLKNFKKLKTLEVKNRCQTLYDVLDYHRKPALFYFPIFFANRLILGVIIGFFSKHPGFQV